MQRRLVIPDLAIELVALQTESRFRQLESFIRADLNRRSQRQQALERQKPNQYHNQGNECETIARSISSRARIFLKLRSSVENWSLGSHLSVMNSGTTEARKTRKSSLHP